MSFVEGISAGSIDIADPAFVLCLGGIALIVSLLLAPPAVATALRFFASHRGLEKIYWLLRTLLGRPPKA